MSVPEWTDTPQHKNKHPYQCNRIALIGKQNSPTVSDLLYQLAQYLHQRDVKVILEQETAEQLTKNTKEKVPWQSTNLSQIGEEADLSIILGGDGTLLNIARQLASSEMPLVGINQGRLGFMTDIARTNLFNHIDTLLAGQFTADYRLMLDVTLVCNGQQHTQHVLNEIVLDKGPTGRLIEFALYIDESLACSLRGDGFIVSTPTGSTAYALSAGGPILSPALAGIALVPLNPHSLTNRPIVVNENTQIELQVIRANNPRVHLDGQSTLTVSDGDYIRVQRGRYQVCLLHPPEYNYIDVLREKLHWNTLPFNKSS